MSLTKKMLIGLGLLLAILLIEIYTNIDILIQNKMYDFTYNEWFIDKYLHERLGRIFYDGIKYFDKILAAIIFILILSSFKLKNLENIRKPLLILFLSLAFVPLIIASAKQITNVYCPKELVIYGGNKPFVNILKPSPEGLRGGKCFPAGHATAGFALMALYFCFNDKKAKIIGLSIGLSLGWISGIYQMLRGQHFLSHTIFTMIASFMIILIIDYFVNKRTSRLFSRGLQL